MNNLKERFTRSAGKAELILKKNGPTMLMIGGALGVLGATVMACAATKKLTESSKMEEIKDDINNLHELHATNTEEDYPEKVYKKDLTTLYFREGVEIAKAYAPAAAVMALSLTAMFASNKAYKQRTVSLAAAYATLESMYNRYRENVVNELGEDADYRFRNSVVREEIEEEIIDPKTGKTKTVKKTVDIVPNKKLDEYSEYARFFEPGNPNYEQSYDEDGNAIYSDSEYNLHFLMLQQCHANDILRDKGHVFLNEVYDMLGFPRTKAGNIVGWVYDLKNPNGDNVIDFGIHEMKRQNMDFVNGYEPVILLDFNVDGPIIDFLK